MDKEDVSTHIGNTVRPSSRKPWRRHHHDGAMAMPGQDDTHTVRLFDTGISKAIAHVGTSTPQGAKYQIRRLTPCRSLKARQITKLGGRSRCQQRNSLPAGLPAPDGGHGQAGRQDLLRELSHRDLIVGREACRPAP